MMTKQQNFCDAVQRLQEAIQDYKSFPNSTMQDGVIQRFEFTFELAWKSLKEYMEAQGCPELQFPKQVLKAAYAAKLIDNERIWLSMLSSRNITSHIYDDSQASKIMSAIQMDYITPLQLLADYYRGT